MIYQFLLFAILVLPTFSDETIPLKQLFEIVKYYPEVSFCERWIVSGYWMDYEAGNVRHITYKGKLKPGETARALCNCMNDHMTQKDWLEGAEKVCYSQCGYITYHVNGRPDATYNPNAAEDMNFDRPLEKLRVVFDNTPKTDPVGLQCATNCIEESNIIYCSLECPFTNDPRTTDEICAEVIDYYNQKEWLEGAYTVCGEKDGFLQVDFMGSA